MAAVLNGTLGDQRFLDDDDSFEDDPMCDIVCVMVSIPIPSTIVVSCDDDPGCFVNVWCDCHQGDDDVSGPNDIVTASSNSAPSDFLEDADVSGPDSDVTASSKFAPSDCIWSNPL